MFLFQTSLEWIGAMHSVILQTSALQGRQMFYRPLCTGWFNEDGRTNIYSLLIDTVKFLLTSFGIWALHCFCWILWHSSKIVDTYHKIKHFMTQNSENNLGYLPFRAFLFREFWNFFTSHFVRCRETAHFVLFPFSRRKLLIWSGNSEKNCRCKQMRPGYRVPHI